METIDYREDVGCWTGYKVSFANSRLIASICRWLSFAGAEHAVKDRRECGGTESNISNSRPEKSGQSAVADHSGMHTGLWTLARFPVPILRNFLQSDFCPEQHLGCPSLGPIDGKRQGRFHNGSLQVARGFSIPSAHRQYYQPSITSEFQKDIFAEPEL
jgi:hypothetical protein